MKIRPKATAAQAAYIQPNPITRAYWLLFDRDRSERFYWPEEWHLPTPNIEVINPDNNHQHLFYLVRPPVYTLRQAREKPLRLMADTDRVLTVALDADPSYGKLLAKNPLCKRWDVIIWHDTAWDLVKLLDSVPKECRRWKPKPREEMGLGRNCLVFEKARKYAYREWRVRGYEDYYGLFDAVYKYALEVNADFAQPLFGKEVICIARSIAKWTARHLTREGMSEWSRWRGRKGGLHSGVTRGEVSADRAREAKALYGSGKTQAQVALAMGISERWVRELLRK
jgi:hypothetical protein